MTSTTYTYTDLDTTFDTLAQAKAYAVTALGMAIESYEKDFAWSAFGYSVLGSLKFWREDNGGWSVQIQHERDYLAIEDEPTPTDTAPVTEQPAPTVYQKFDRVFADLFECAAKPHISATTDLYVDESGRLVVYEVHAVNTTCPRTGLNVREVRTRRDTDKLDKVFGLREDGVAMWDGDTWDNVYVSAKEYALTLWSKIIACSAYSDDARPDLDQPLTDAESDITEYTDPTPTPTDTAPVTEQPAPTFDELRAATNAASAAELAAHNALVKAENAYASAAEVDPNDRHGWNRATGRFARTKAGQQLHAALTEARKVLREAVRVDTEACRKTWVNGFGTLNAPAEQPAPVDPSSLALDPENNDFQRGYGDGLYGKSPIWVSTAEYNHGYAAGQADALATDDLMTNDAGLLRVQLTDADAEITRLNRIITDLQVDLHTCERKVKAAQDAADNAATAALAEIEQLTARLDAVIGGEPVIKIWHDAEYDPRPWRYAIRECSRVAQFDCKTEAEAQEKTQTHLENWRKEQARARR